MVKPAQSMRQASSRLAEKRVILLDEPTRPPSTELLWARAWFALYVLPAWEWRVFRTLKREGFDAFLPVSTYWNASRFRVKRQLERALLTRYVFVGAGSRPRRRLTDQEWNTIAGIEGVMAVLGDPGGPLFVPVENLVALAGEVASGAYDTTQDTFPAGAHVTITAGPFATFGGVVETAVPSDAGPDDMIGVMMRIFGRDSLAKIPLADLKQIG